MLEPVEILSNRRSLRRCVDMSCDIISEQWSGPVPHRVRELSENGMWVESELPLDGGMEVLLRFTLGQHVIHTTARVCRVDMFRRQSERRRAGMGLDFGSLEMEDKEIIRLAIEGMPPRLPLRRRPRVRREWVWIDSVLTENDRELNYCFANLADTEISFKPLGPLLA